MNPLAALRECSTVVADTGDFDQLARLQPRDATTNPSLIFKAVQMPAHQKLLEQTRAQCTTPHLSDLSDALLIRFGTEILAHVPGRVSTEIDVMPSFETQATVQRARRLIERFKEAGVDTERRVLIKIAATWEGIQAAAILEREGIHCNLTLVFALCQAVACADAGVTLISPFVGRITDWHRQKAIQSGSAQPYDVERDPGVQSVRQIYQYYKQHGIATEVMGASFRNVEQIAALAGCDLLTISPELLDALQQSDLQVQRKLHPVSDPSGDIEALHYNESDFRFALNEDAMATEKLAEGIRGFAADARKLEALLKG